MKNLLQWSHEVYSNAFSWLKTNLVYANLSKLQKNFEPNLKFRDLQIYIELEIKTFGLGFRTRDVCS